MDLLLEARGGIVDDFIGPQFAQKVAIACRGSRDDLRPRPMSKLDGKDPDASCTTMDKEGLPCSEVRVVKESLPGCQRRERNGCSLHRIERAWFGSQLIGQGKGIVGLSAVATIAEHGKDLRAFDDRRDPRTHLLYHS